MKRLLVAAMVGTCGFLDRHYQLLPWPLTKLACPAGLALWSSELDERWHTGVWQDADAEEVNEP